MWNGWKCVDVYQKDDHWGARMNRKLRFLHLVPAGGADQFWCSVSMQVRASAPAELREEKYVPIPSVVLYFHPVCAPVSLGSLADAHGLTGGGRWA